MERIGRIDDRRVFALVCAALAVMAVATGCKRGSVSWVIDDSDVEITTEQGRPARSDQPGGQTAAHLEISRPDTKLGRALETELRATELGKHGTVSIHIKPYADDYDDLKEERKLFVTAWAAWGLAPEIRVISLVGNIDIWLGETKLLQSDEHIENALAPMVAARLATRIGKHRPKVAAPLPLPGTITALTVGDDISCLQDKKGSVFCNYSIGDRGNWVPGFDGAKHLTAGRQTACGVVDGETRCLLHRGSYLEPSSDPWLAQPICGLDGAERLAVGAAHVCGLVKGNIHCAAFPAVPTGAKDDAAQQAPCAVKVPWSSPVDGVVDFAIKTYSDDRLYMLDSQKLHARNLVDGQDYIYKEVRDHHAVVALPRAICTLRQNRKEVECDNILGQAVLKVERDLVDLAGHRERLAGIDASGRLYISAPLENVQFMGIGKSREPISPRSLHHRIGVQASTLRGGPDGLMWLTTSGEAMLSEGKQPIAPAFPLGPPDLQLQPRIETE